MELEMNGIFKIFFCLISLNTLVFSQENLNVLGWEYVEIYMITVGLDNQETIRYKMQAVSSVWEKNIIPPYNYLITNDYKFLYYPPILAPETTNSNPNEWYNWMGFNHQYSNNVSDSLQMDSFAYGIYRITQNIGQAYFYIDYRDNNYGNYYNCDGHCQDIWLKYDKNKDEFSYLNNGLEATSFNSNSWKVINTGNYLCFSSTKNQASPSTNEFPDFWENSLVSIPSEVSGSNLFYVPHLVWGPKPNYSA